MEEVVRSRANLPHVQLRCEAMEVLLEEEDACRITKNCDMNGNDEELLEEAREEVEVGI